MRKKLLSIGMLCIILAVLTGCNKAGSLEKDGKRSLAVGDYNKAAESFLAAITTNPNRAEYYIDYGLTLIALGKYEEALKQLDQAYINKDMMIIKENNKKVLRGKGIAYYHQSNYKNAIKEFQEALEINELSELNMDILYYMADSLYITGEYEEAAKAYTSIIKIDKKAAVDYSRRAYCYKSYGEFEKSLSDYNKAIKMEPDNYEHYFGKYYLLVENKDVKEALAVLEEAKAIAPTTSEDEYNLAKIHFYEGDYDTALSELSEGYANGFVEAYYYVGEIYRLKKDYAKAIYYYEYYIDGGEVNTPNIFNQIAVCLLKTDQAQEALEYLEQGILSNNAGIIQILKKNEIIAYEKLGNYEEAKKKMDEYLSSYPKDKKAIREATFIETRVLSMVEDSNIE